MGIQSSEKKIKRKKAMVRSGDDRERGLQPVGGKTEVGRGKRRRRGKRMFGEEGVGGRGRGGRGKG